MATDELARQAVDAIEAISGHHPGFRAAHAKGTLCAATFTPTTEAAHLTRAAHFRDGPVRAHVRFSNGSGNPAADQRYRVFTSPQLCLVVGVGASVLTLM